MSFLNRAGHRCLAVLALGAAALAPAAAQTGTMYRCPGNDYNNTLTAKEAKDKGCKTIDGAPITIIQITKQRPAAAAAPGASGTAATRIDPAEQRARDNDARRILEAELKREEERLAAMRTEYNNGEPERRGDEKNNQKYLDRVSDMKSALARKENDIASIKRELAKLPS
ncbi:MAG: hypothetical protein ABL916_08075 [Burkholderiaceae bacterium]